MIGAWSHAAGSDEEPWARRPRSPRFPLSLPLCYVVPATGAWGDGVTHDVSRTGVRFHPSEPNLRVGDRVRFVMILPGQGGGAGAIASCLGRVVRTSPDTVAVTIEEQQLQSERAARADLRQPLERRLVAWWEGAGLLRMRH
jgi:PilZ domain